MVLVNQIPVLFLQLLNRLFERRSHFQVVPRVARLLRVLVFRGLNVVQVFYYEVVDVDILIRGLPFDAVFGQVGVEEVYLLFPGAGALIARPRRIRVRAPGLRFDPLLVRGVYYEVYFDLHVIVVPR